VDELCNQFSSDSLFTFKNSESKAKTALEDNISQNSEIKAPAEKIDSERVLELTNGQTISPKPRRDRSKRQIIFALTGRGSNSI
jgi:hypothetical protein